MSRRRAVLQLRVFALAAGLGLGAIACRTPGGPEHTAQAYARALEEGRLDEAYQLTAQSHRARVSRKEFHARYAEEGQRRARAAAVREASAQLRATAPELEAVREPEGWRVLEAAAEEGPAEVLTRFVDASDRGDFAAAYSLLAQGLRARYTPERLKADFAAEPLARERLRRARAALEVPPLVRGDVAEFPVGDGKSVRLVREGASYKVAALE